VNARMDARAHTRPIMGGLNPQESALRVIATVRQAHVTFPSFPDWLVSASMKGSLFGQPTRQ
jgi:hypothetical protein